MPSIDEFQGHVLAHLRAAVPEGSSIHEVTNGWRVDVPPRDLGTGRTYDEAEQAIAREGTDWLGITIDGRFAGWTRVDDVRAARADGTPLTDVERFPPSAQVEPTSTLRAAMELIMSSNSSVAVIHDAGRFGGVVTLEDIRRALSSDDIEAEHGNV